MTFQPTSAQIQTITAEVRDFTARNGRSPETIDIRESVYADERPGAVSYTLSSPATKADGSDWCMAASTLLTDGSHWDTDPVKPWELA